MKRRHFLKLAGAAIVMPKLLSSTKDSSELRVVLIDEQLELIRFSTKPQTTVEKHETRIEWLVNEKRSLFCIQVYDAKNRLVYEKFTDLEFYPGDTFTVIIPEKYVVN